MRGVGKLGVGLAVAAVVGGLLVVQTRRVHDAAQRTQCQNTLRQIGLATANYRGMFTHFPAGTVPNADLPPDKRLGWLTELVPCMEASLDVYLLEKGLAWDAPENCPLRCRRYAGKPSSDYREFRNAGPPYFVCPANPAAQAPDLPYPTSFVGVAGLGESAAELPLSDPRAGLFGYDRRPSPKDVKDGLSTTLLAAEVLDGGPWTAGGRATVRGLVSGRPYLGEGGQFAGGHRGGELTGPRPVVTNVAFADGHARPLTDAVSPAVLEGLATIAGGEDVGEW